MFESIGKLFLGLGCFILFIGVIFIILDKIGSFYKLPGDIMIKRENFIFYFPIATSILLSLILTIIINLFRRR